MSLTQMDLYSFNWVQNMSLDNIIEMFGNIFTYCLFLFYEEQCGSLFQFQIKSSRVQL